MFLEIKTLTLNMTESAVVVSETGVTVCSSWSSSGDIPGGIFPRDGLSEIKERPAENYEEGAGQKDRCES